MVARFNVAALMKTMNIVMGVSGSGKSTVAAMLASRVGGVFLDADDFHPVENKRKMAASIPLTDEDRWPWLDEMNRELKARATRGQTVFLACSALREIYRSRLAAGLPGLRLIYLKGSEELIFARMQGREGHFMPPTLLASQFALLEEPADALVVPIEKTPDEIIRLILAELNLLEGGGYG